MYKRSSDNGCCFEVKSVPDAAKVTEYNFAITPCMANVSIYKRSPRIYALAITISKMIKMYMLDLQKVGHGHGVQFAD